MNRLSRLIRLFAALTAALLLMAACRPSDLQDVPGLPDDLRDIPEVIRALQLHRLSGIDMPGDESLPEMESRQGAVVYRGPFEREMKIGDRIPGTDITLESIDEGRANFRIGDLERPAQIGDSLAYDGSWSALDDTRYNVRLRIYRVLDDAVHVAGVHQLQISDLDSQQGSLPESEYQLSFPFADGVTAGVDTIAGTTFGYLGKNENGAQLSGVPETQYPYRMVGDSIEWMGTLRPDIGAEYDLRMLLYAREDARVGGLVTLHLPTD
jgi:hypothetical protein